MKDKKIVDDPLEMLLGSVENTIPVPYNNVNNNDQNAIRKHIENGGSVVMVPKDSKAIIVSQKFNPEVQKKIDELAIELTAVGIIASQDDASKANITLAKAKKIIKSLESERKMMTSVLEDEKKSLMRYEEKIVEKLESLVNLINTRITDFQKAELKKQQEKEAELKAQRDAELAESNRKAAIQQKILSFENSVITAISTATIADIDEKIKRLESMKVTPEIYMEFLSSATEMYQRCITAMASRKIELVHINKLERENKEQAAILKAQQDEKLAQAIEEQNEKMSIIEEVKQNEIANSQMGYEFKVSSGEKIKDIQQKWKFDTESIDMSLLPEKYKMPNEKKIKEAIAAGCKEIPGVRIYQDIVNVSR